MSQVDECPNSLYQIMRMCWQFDAADRPNFSQIIEPEVDKNQKYLLVSCKCLIIQFDLQPPLQLSPLVYS